LNFNPINDKLVVDEQRGLIKMKSITLDDLRLLFNYYSPLKTDQQLIEAYTKISQSNFDPSKDIRDIYNKLIQRGFLNESVIKAAFIEKFSFKQKPSHVVSVFELNTGSSRADICMFNGKSMVFEIKTEYDTFTRLDRQLSDYKKAYEYLNLIIPKSKLSDALDLLDEEIGIITYTTKNKRILFETHKEPVLNHHIEPSFQLDQLTKKQLESIVNNPHLTKQELITIIRKTYNPTEINRFFIESMKSKYFSKWSYLYANKSKIKPLDYQWFFKNNISIEAVYS